jgi:hypothetical protein
VVNLREKIAAWRLAHIGRRTLPAAALPAAAPRAIPVMVALTREFSLWRAGAAQKITRNVNGKAPTVNVDNAFLGLRLPACRAGKPRAARGPHAQNRTRYTRCRHGPVPALPRRRGLEQVRIEA